MIRRIAFPLLVLFLIECPPPTNAQVQSTRLVEIPQEKVARLEYIRVIRKDSSEFDLPRLDVGTGWLVFTKDTVTFIPKVVGTTYKAYELNGSSWVGDWPMEYRDAKPQ